MSVKSIFAEIEAERAHQDRKWGGPAHDDAHTPKDWFYYILEWYQQATKAFQDRREADMRHHLIQVAALIVAFIQSWDRHHEVTNVDTHVAVNAATNRWSDTSEKASKRTSNVKASRILLTYDWLTREGKGACFQAEVALNIDHQSMSPLFGEMWLARVIRKSPEVAKTTHKADAHLYVPMAGVDPVKAVQQIRHLFRQEKKRERDALRDRREVEDKRYFGVV